MCWARPVSYAPDTVVKPMRRKARRTRLHFRVRTVLLLFVVFGFLTTVPLVPRSREVFSPDTLKKRVQTDYLLFGIIPVRSGHYEYDSYELVDYLVAKGYWVPQRVENPRWITMCYWEDFRRPSECSSWIELSATHPELTRFVWPVALDLLRSSGEDHDEWLTCIFLCHAESADTVAQLKTELPRGPEYRLIWSAIRQTH